MTDDERNDLPPLAGGEESFESETFGGDDAPIDAPEPVEESTGQPTGKPDPEHHLQFVGTGVFWSLVVGVILAVIVIVFAAQNTHSARVDAFFWEWSAPLFMVILIALLVGIVLDEIVGLLLRSRRRRHLAEKAELDRLRGKR